MKRDVDFFSVKAEHAEIHDRLENWARWSHSRQARAQSPIWRLGKPSQHWEAIPVPVIVDKMAAQAMEKQVCKLPEKHRMATVWCYVLKTSPIKAARELAVSRDGLMDLVHSARQILVNRGAV